MTPDDEDLYRPQLRLRADAIVALSGDSLIVRARGLWSRIRPGDPGVARSIHDALRRDSFLTAACPGKESLRHLVDLGALAPVEPIRLWDRLGARDVITAPVARVETGPDIPSSENERWVVLARRDDPALGPALSRLGLRAHLVGLVAARGPIVARSSEGDDGRGCARCAWLGERDQVDDIPPAQVEAAPLARAARGWIGRRCAQLVDALLLGVETLPPGHAWIEPLGAPRTAHPIARHPACDCWRDRSAVADVSWEALEGRAFAPVWPVERGDHERSARVVFRRSSRGEIVSPTTLGVALGSGPDRGTRALAEAIERSAMHHALAVVRSSTALDLGDRAWTAPQIEALLFRPPERAEPAFRFPGFEPTMALDWTPVRSLSDGREALAPAALVGHVSREQRLVAATSNGYACHRDERAATMGALLELIERDAILLSWYLGRPWVRLVDVGDAQRDVYLCTQDVDLPVVFACACAEDGSLRTGSAAALDLDGVIAHATAELDVAVAGRPPKIARPPLDRVDVLHGPEDHVAHVAGPAGRRVFDGLRERASERRRTDVDRWASAAAHDPVERVTSALARVGLEAWIADRSLPQVFGAGWVVVRALVPGLVELSFGLGYRRLASPRIAAALEAGERLNPMPHPIG